MNEASKASFVKISKEKSEKPVSYEFSKFEKSGVAVSDVGKSKYSLIYRESVAVVTIGTMLKFHGILKGNCAYFLLLSKHV